MKLRRYLLLPVLLLSCAKMSPSMSSDAKMSEGNATMAPSPEMMMDKADPKSEEKKPDGEKGKAKPWGRSNITPNLSRLMVGDKEELPLNGIQSEVRIDGSRARVILDLFFYNDREQRLEGSFSLRLPDGASMHFLAFGVLNQQQNVVAASPEKPVFTSQKDFQKAGFEAKEVVLARADTWSTPKVARVIQKEQAAVAYRNTVRQNVDPAIAEWAGAGIFNAKLFPLEPRKMHRVVVAYDLDLLRVGSDLMLQLDLPTTVPERIVDLNIASLKGVKVSVSPDAKIFTEGNRQYGRVQNPDEKGVTVTLSGLASPLLTGKDASGGYFAARFTPELPKTAQGSAERAIFIVDTSLSANPDQFNIWLKMMQAVLEKNRDSIKEFSVVFFNVEAFWWQERFVENSDANVKSLMTYAQTLALEGASNVGQALKAASAPTWDTQALTSDLFLLSDAASTWGESDLYALSQPLLNKQVGSLFAYKTGLPGTDNQALEHLAREGGGAVFAVTGEQDVDAAATAHRAKPWEIESVSVPGSKDLLFAGAPRVLFPGQEVRLVGRGIPEDGATVSLNVKQGEEKKTLQIKLSAAIETLLAPRTYGQEAVSQLEALGEPTEEAALFFARHFQVVGKSASLLLLESEADYERFGIKPENDAARVNETLVAQTLAETRRIMEDLLSDPKEFFLAWVRRLPKLPAMQIPITDELYKRFEALPSASFRLSGETLTCKKHTWEGASAELQTQLQTRALDYDVITKEAAQRKALSGCDALKTLSSLVENSPGDTVLARDVGFSAMELGLPWQSYNILRRVIVARPDEPQTYHAIALALAEAGADDLAMAYFEIGLAGAWDARFGDFKTIVGLDYMRFLQTAKLSDPSFASQRRTSLIKEIGITQADIVVSISWNTDGTDVDLHIKEPGLFGEECFYSHRETRIGGKLTRDVTQGYGPEMYVLPNAKGGDYKIWAHYYASDRIKASARTKVYATIFQNWGKPNETVTRKVVSLADNKEDHNITTLSF